MTRLREVQAVPGVAISGFGMNGDVQKSLAAGFSTHLIKPITFEQLEEAIARTLNQAGEGSYNVEGEDLAVTSSQSPTLRMR